MKKFIVFAILAALAGITVGAIRRQAETTTAAVVQTAAGATTTSTTPTPAASTPTSSTTSPKAAAKLAAKVATTTTRPTAAPSSPKPVDAPTTTTPAAPSTTTTVATSNQVTPACSTSAAPAAAGSYIGGGTWEDVRISSNMPKTRTRLTVRYPSLKQQQFWLTTDASGAVKKIFYLTDSGTTSVSVDFYDVAENHVGGSPACQTTFMATMS